LCNFILFRNYTWFSLLNIYLLLFMLFRLACMIFFIWMHLFILCFHLLILFLLFILLSTYDISHKSIHKLTLLFKLLIITLLDNWFTSLLFLLILVICYLWVTILIEVLWRSYYKKVILDLFFIVTFTFFIL
jgi:hypothetical protein